MATDRPVVSCVPCAPVGVPVARVLRLEGVLTYTTVRPLSEFYSHRTPTRSLILDQEPSQVAGGPVSSTCRFALHHRIHLAVAFFIELPPYPPSLVEI